MTVVESVPDLSTLLARGRDIERAHEERRAREAAERERKRVAELAVKWQAHYDVLTTLGLGNLTPFAPLPDESPFGYDTYHEFHRPLVITIPGIGVVDLYLNKDGDVWFDAPRPTLLMDEDTGATYVHYHRLTPAPHQMELFADKPTLDNFSHAVFLAQRFAIDENAIP